MSTEPRVVNLEAKDEFQAAMDLGERSMPQRKRQCEQRAALYYTFYSALIREGFDEEGALRLTESEFVDFN